MTTDRELPDTPANQVWEEAHNKHMAKLFDALGETKMTTDHTKDEEICGAYAEGGLCILPKGHNRGNLDIPSNHKAASKDEAFEALSVALLREVWPSILPNGHMEERLKKFAHRLRATLEAPLLVEIERSKKHAANRLTGLCRCGLERNALRSELSAAQERIKELEAALTTQNRALSCDQIKLAHRVGELEAELDNIKKVEFGKRIDKVCGDIREQNVRLNAELVALKSQEPVAWKCVGRTSGMVNWWHSAGVYEAYPREYYEIYPLYFGPSPIPEGMQLVPKEPTEAMEKAGWEAPDMYPAQIYRAMLAAAGTEKGEKGV